MQSPVEEAAGGGTFWGDIVLECLLSSSPLCAFVASMS